MGVLIIFLLIFVPFILFIWKMLVHTKNTVGEHSPFAVSKTYKPNSAAFQIMNFFFVLLAVGFSILCLWFSSALLGFSDIRLIGFGVLLVLVSLFFLYTGLVHAVISYNHWQNDQKYTITLLPEGRKVILENQGIEFTSDEIAAVKVVTNAHTRWNKSYYQYTLTNGYTFAISLVHPAAELLTEFLTNKNGSVKETYFPLIEGGVKWPLLEQIYHVFDRRFIKEIIGIGVCLLILATLLTYYRETQIEESHFQKQLLVIKEKTKYRAQKSNGYNLWVEYNEQLHRVAVTSKIFYRYPIGNKIELLYDSVHNTFYAERPSKDFFFFIGMVGIIAVFLTVRIIYLIVFPKTFH